MSEFKKYNRIQIAELRPYIEGEDLTNIDVSTIDKKNGSPKSGDMIARNPDNHSDKWLISKEYFEKNFKLVE